MENSKARPWLFGLFILTGLTIYLTGVTQYVSFESLRKNRQMLKDLADSHPSTAPLVYMAVYFTLGTHPPHTFVLSVLQ